MAVSSSYSRFNRKTLYMGLLKFTVVDGKILGSRWLSQGGQARAKSCGWRAVKGRRQEIRYIPPRKQDFEIFAFAVCVSMWLQCVYNKITHTEWLKQQKGIVSQFYRLESPRLRYWDWFPVSSFFLASGRQTTHCLPVAFPLWGEEISGVSSPSYNPIELGLHPY